MSKELPQLAGIFEAFRDLLVEQAVLRCELGPIDCSVVTIDPSKYVQGVPILGMEAFVVPVDFLSHASRRIVRSMEKSFPRISHQLKVLRDFVDAEMPFPYKFFGALQIESEGLVVELAQSLGIKPQVVQFVAMQIKKPYAQKKAESLPSLPDGLYWSKGYCPVCGSWPETSFLEQRDGRRFLRCSFCAHEWSFPRLQCPFCETSQPKQLELLFSEDRAFERAELCHQCMKYIVGIDLRGRALALVKETASLGLVYLDILAQQRNFTPGARTPWNAF